MRRKLFGSGAEEPEPPVTREQGLKADAGTSPEKIEAKLRGKNAVTDRRQRWWLGWGALVALGVQFVLVNLFFYLYAHDRGWGEVAPGAISAWTGATVVQIVVIVRTMAEYLFPKGSAPAGVRQPGAQDDKN